MRSRSRASRPASLRRRSRSRRSASCGGLRRSRRVLASSATRVAARPDRSIDRDRHGRLQRAEQRPGHRALPRRLCTVTAIGRALDRRRCSPARSRRLRPSSRGPLAVLAAHLVAQVGRRGGDRLQRIDGAERRHQPGQAARCEALLEQLRGLLGAHHAGARAEHHDDQLAAVARRGRHHVEAGRADEAGLHAVGVGIAADQRRWCCA